MSGIDLRSIGLGAASGSPPASNLVTFRGIAGGGSRDDVIISYYFFAFTKCLIDSTPSKRREVL